LEGVKRFLMKTGLAASMAATVCFSQAVAFGQDSTAKKAVTPAKPAAAAPKPAAVPAKPAAAKPAAAKPVVTAKPVVASATNPVVLTVGAEAITQSEFESFLAALPEQVRAQMPKRRIAEQIADIKVYAAEARKRNLDKTAMARLEMEQALASSLFRDVQGKINPTPADMAAYYEQNKQQYEKVKARHILLRFQGSPVPAKEGQKDLTKEEAKAKAEELKKAIDGGADFAELAKKESDDAGSGANGGDLGAFGRGMMVPPFEQAAFALPIGKTSDPVESQFGYHIIQVQEKLGQDFASAKGEIEPKIKPELAKKAMDEIKAAGKVVLNESYFAEPLPAGQSQTGFGQPTPAAPPVPRPKLP
jgi:parvulin-like peptidyl-prolyl isomerase